MDTVGLGREKIAGWQWRILLVLTSINLLNYFDRLLAIPMFPTLKNEFHISDAKLGILASVVLLVDCLTALPAGYWSDRGPRQKIMAVGVWVWSAATFLSGVAPSYGSLLAARGAVASVKAPMRQVARPSSRRPFLPGCGRACKASSAWA